MISTMSGEAVGLSRAEKKKQWRKIFAAANSKRNILEKPRPKAFDTSTMTRGEIAQAERINRLQKREYKLSKKLYKKRTVREVYINDATGKVGTHKIKVLDTDKKKPLNKVRKPKSLLSMATLGIAGTTSRNTINKAYGEAMASDNIGASAGVKTLKAGSTIIRGGKRLSKSMVRHKQLSKQKSMDKAEYKLRKAQNKLQMEQARKPDAKAGRIAAQRKRRRASITQKFRNKIRKARRRAEESVTKMFIGNKLKMAALGAGAVVIIMLLPMFIAPMLMGGGGGTAIAGSAASALVYPVDNYRLIDFNDQFNEMMWRWQNDLNNDMNGKSAGDTEEWLIVTEPCESTLKYVGGPMDKSDDTPDEDSDYDENGEYKDNCYTVIKNLYGGERSVFTDYNIRSLYAYFSVKYGEKWVGASDEFTTFMNAYYELKCDESKGDIIADESYDVVLDTHITLTWDEESKTYTKTSEEEHTVTVTRKIRYYYLYPKDVNFGDPFGQYIAHELSKIGKEDDNGKSEGTRRYEVLMESLGGHQLIRNCFKYDGEYIDWSSYGNKFGSYGELLDKNLNSEVEGVMSDFRYENESADGLEITEYLPRIEVVAGGKGKIKAKTESAVTVEYDCGEETVTVTYQLTGGQPAGITQTPIDGTVKNGDHLFYADEINSVLGVVPPKVKVTTHIKSETLSSYINPAIVIQQKPPETADKSKEGG